jgi:phage N-6-adenine-methyltransferase
MDTKLPSVRPTDEIQQYDPDKGLKTIAVAEAAEKALKRKLRNDPNDPFARQELRDVIARKITEQADYVVWRSGVVVPSKKLPGAGRGQGKRVSLKKPSKDLPDIDPGKVTVSRWGNKLCRDKEHVDDPWQHDDAKQELAIEDSWLRAVSICELDKTVRGTEGKGNNEWWTPEEYIELAREMLGEIELDPATSEGAQRVVKTTRFYTKDENGLQQDWNGRVWLNPPYARKLIGKFIKKLCEEVRVGRVTEAILLTHNYTSSAWFQDEIAPNASAICFSERVAFEPPDGDPANPTQGQAFSYFGPNVDRFEKIFGSVGFIARGPFKTRKAPQ